MDRFNLSPLKDKKTALVLSGGVVKAAAWHIGVALALEEMGFVLRNNQSEESSYDISTYVGSSAGSLIGLMFASGFKVQDIMDSFIDNKKKIIKPITYKDILAVRKPLKNPPRTNFYDPLDGMPFFLRAIFAQFLKINGFFSTYGLVKYINQNISTLKNFEELKADLFVVASQLDYSKKVIFGKYNYPTPAHDSTAEYMTGVSMADAVAASMSVPPFFSPYPLKNENTNEINYYIDGEIRETLSTHVASDNKCEVIISSWTHTPYHYHEEVGSLINFGLPAICVQAIHLLIEKKIIDSRAKLNSAADIVDTVNRFLKDHAFEDKNRIKLLDILERKLNFKSNIKYIDIYPKHSNFKIFLANSFSLNPKTNQEIIRMGRDRTFEVFANEESLIRY
jgi:predicted acylesterase/phospholipase RssA